jgi:hypothetical protein
MSPRARNSARPRCDDDALAGRRRADEEKDDDVDDDDDVYGVDYRASG